MSVYIVYKISVYFFTREKAITIVSPLIIKTAKRFVRILVPNVNSAADFDKFKNTIMKRSQRLRLLYGITFPVKSDDLLKLHVANCPFAEMAKRLGYSDLCPYICHGDWEVAKGNIDKWDFERKHQIGTGDSFCDHTYKKKDIKIA